MTTPLSFTPLNELHESMLIQIQTFATSAAKAYTGSENLNYVNHAYLINHTINGATDFVKVNTPNEDYTEAFISALHALASGKTVNY